MMKFIKVIRVPGVGPHKSGYGIGTIEMAFNGKGYSVLSQEGHEGLPPEFWVGKEGMTEAHNEEHKKIMKDIGLSNSYVFDLTPFTLHDPE